MKTFSRTFKVGKTPEGWNVWVEINWDEKRLSITGVEGPYRSGDCKGSCGQTDVSQLNPRLAEIWKEYHLNDMQPGCEHQRKNWNLDEKVEVVHYTLTTEAWQLREKLLISAQKAGLLGEKLELTQEERYLVELEDWYYYCYKLPDQKELTKYFKESKRETKTVTWIYPKEHPKGLLTKPCEICGYKYGSQWLTKEVPEEILIELAAFPDEYNKYPWRK